MTLGPAFPSVAFGAIMTVLGGCTTYAGIDPEGAAEDVRRSSGYYQLQDVKPGQAKVVARSSGATVKFSVSTEAEHCQGFQTLGRTAYVGQGVIYPWIAKMVQRSSGVPPYLVYDAKLEQAIQMQGYGWWSSGSSPAAKGAPSTYSSGHCGPLTVQFTPHDGHAYTVNFIWGVKGVSPNRDTCAMTVMDATDPDQPVPVTAEPIQNCPAP